MNYAELAQRLYGKPQLAIPSLLKTASYLIENEMLQIKQQPLDARKDDVYIKDGIGYVEVKGTLVDEESWMDADCGITSYERLTGEFDYLIKQQNIKDIVMIVNSGGGEAYGAFESAEYVRNLADEYGVKITAYVDKIAASGGYVWASIAHEVIANKMSEVGSIGVVVQLINDSEYLKQNGFERVFVYSGDQKIPFADDGKFKEEFINDIQTSVDDTYSIFVEHVSKYRNLGVDSVKGTQARVFSADEALKLGLIDKIESRPSFRNSLEVKRSTEQKMNFFKTAETQDTTTMITELQETNQSLSNQLNELQSTLSAEQQKVESYLGEKAQLIEKISQLEASLKQYEDEKLQKIKDERVAKITAVVAEDKVNDIYESTQTLSDAQFDVILSTFATSKQAKKEEMKELGFGSQVDQEKVEQPEFGKSLANFIANKKGKK